MSVIEAQNCIENRLSDNARVWSVTNAGVDAFVECCDRIAEAGYTKEESYQVGAHNFCAFRREDCGIFVNYYGAVQTLRVVYEQGCQYFAFTDAPRKAQLPTQVTQVKLADYGLCYAIRLPDGRFIVIDGGTGYDEDHENLIKCLRDGSPWEKPVIAAWILSHPHSDHYYGYLKFMELYADEVVVEKYMLNFPDPEDYEHYPALAGKPTRAFSETMRMREMYGWFEKTGVPYYVTRTGQRYRIGAANCEILSTLEDTIHVSSNINATSLVIRMELEGQIILWTNDAGLGYSDLAGRYGTYLRSDILQIPHHGFQCGDAAGEIAGYEQIRPKICLLPVSGYNAFANFCVFREAPDHLMRMSCVEELITGAEQHTLTLPYVPSEDGKRDLARNRLVGRDSAGACSWIFTGLRTDRPEDLNFTALNITYVAAKVRIEMYFNEKPLANRNIMTEVKGACVQDIHIGGEETFGKGVELLKERGLPENAPFAVRFISDVPIVVSHPDHAPAYRSSVSW